MAGKLFVSISHKGGTGRSVTSANIAYRLASYGLKTCCVDLDLQSPTLGAVLELDDLEQGADYGTHDFLCNNPLEASKAPDYVKSVWKKSKNGSKLEKYAGARHRNFDILPGKRGHVTIAAGRDLTDHLTSLLSSLRESYEIVLVDMSSGLSDETNAMLKMKGATIDAWLVYYRWTRQHLYGAERLSLILKDCKQTVLLVRTAYQQLSDNDLEQFDRERQKFFRRRNNDLEILRTKLFASKYAHIADIPFDQVLLWDEKVFPIKDTLGETTSKAYDKIANVLREGTF